MSFLSRLIEGFKAFWFGPTDPWDDPWKDFDGFDSFAELSWDMCYCFQLHHVNGECPIQPKDPYFESQEVPDEQWD